MLQRIWILLSLSVALLPGAQFTDLYFFGDSLTDTGSIYGVTSTLNSRLFGLVPVTPAAPYVNGRFSNGPVWAEQVALRLGQPGDAAPAPVPLSIFGTVPGTGNNYAIGGARTGVGGALGSFDSFFPTGVLAQINNYLTQKGTADAGALYFMGGGGNDLRDIAKLADSTARANAAFAAADLTAYGMYTLYAAGARNFLLMNGANIGFIPESIQGGLVNQGIEASYYFNYRLAEWAGVLGGLQGMKLSTFDLFGFYNNLFVDTLNGGSVYGFTNPATPCIPTTPNAPSCATSLFFDSIHPTTAVHQLVGNAVADQIASFWGGAATRVSALEVNAVDAAVPEPVTTTAVGVTVGVLVLAYRRRRAA